MLAKERGALMSRANGKKCIMNDRLWRFESHTPLKAQGSCLLQIPTECLPTTSPWPPNPGLGHGILFRVCVCFLLPKFSLQGRDSIFSVLHNPCWLTSSEQSRR